MKAMINDVEMNPIDLPEHIAGLFQRWTHLSIVQIPKHCGQCGKLSRGSWLFGYYLPCLSSDGVHEGVRMNRTIPNTTSNMSVWIVEMKLLTDTGLGAQVVAVHATEEGAVRLKDMLQSRDKLYEYWVKRASVLEEVKP